MAEIFETLKTLFCMNSGIEHTKNNPPDIRSMNITKEDVQEFLFDVDNEFFTPFPQGEGWWLDYG